MYRHYNDKFEWWYREKKYSNDTGKVTFVVPKPTEKKPGFIIGNANHYNLLILVACSNAVVRCDTVFRSSAIGDPTITVTYQDTTVTIELSLVADWGLYEMHVFW